MEGPPEGCEVNNYSLADKVEINLSGKQMKCLC